MISCTDVEANDYESVTSSFISQLSPLSNNSIELSYFFCWHNCHIKLCKSLTPRVMWWELFVKFYCPRRTVNFRRFQTGYIIKAPRKDLWVASTFLSWSFSELLCFLIYFSLHAFQFTLSKSVGIIRPGESEKYAKCGKFAPMKVLLKLPLGEAVLGVNYTYFMKMGDSELMVIYT